MKTTAPILFIFITVTFCITSAAFSPSAVAISLDDADQLDRLDRQDTEDYINKAQKAADREDFSSAGEFLEKAEKLGIQKAEIEKARRYVEKKRQLRDQRVAAERKAEQQRRQAAGRASSGSGSSGSSSGLLSIKFETGGTWISNEINEYTIEIQRTALLSGKTVLDWKQTDTGGTGFFTGGNANFFDIPFGYYEVKAFGLYNGKKVYATAWKNIRHNCGHHVLTLYGNNRSPYSYCVK